MNKVTYEGRYRFPTAIIHSTVRMHVDQGITAKDIRKRLAVRGIAVSVGAIKTWISRFAAQNEQGDVVQPVCASWRTELRPVMISGKRAYLWLALNSTGDVVDIVAQHALNKGHAIRKLTKLIGCPPPPAREWYELNRRKIHLG